MARASEDICPICLDTLHRAAWAVPCRHRFCFSCIRRWTEMKPECPLCKRTVNSIQMSQQGDNFEMFPRRPSAASLDGTQEERRHQPPALPALRMRQRWNLYAGFAGGLHPSTWGFLFWKHPDLLQPLRPWLRRELGHMLGQEHSQVLRLEDAILNALPILGLHEERLVQELQIHLQSRTTEFVQRLIGFTVEQCRRTTQHFLLSGDARAARDLEESPGDVTCFAVFRRWQDRSPVVSSSWAAYQESGEGNLMASTSSAASPGGSPAPRPAPSSSTATDELPGPSAAALQGRPGCSSSIPAPIPRQQEELSRELGEAAADASAPGQGRACSCPAPQRPVQRFVGSLHPCTWGVFFRIRPDLPQLLLPWLLQELGHMLGEERSQELRLGDTVLRALPVLGLHEERLVEELQPHLQSHTRAFVKRLIGYTVTCCGKKAHQILHRVASQAARALEESPGEVICSALFRRWQDHSPEATTDRAAQQERGEGNLVAITSPSASPGVSPEPRPAPSSSAAAGDADELPGPSSAALQERPGCPSSMPHPTPGQQEGLSREPCEAAADASAPGQGRACSCPAPQRPRKRKATGSEDAGTPAKKPPPQRW